MVKKNSVTFQGSGYTKEWHHLNEEEHNLVVRALYTGFGSLGSDGIVIGSQLGRFPDQWENCHEEK